MKVRVSRMKNGRVGSGVPAQSNASGSGQKEELRTDSGFGDGLIVRTLGFGNFRG